jgi:hypothetical protein
MQQINKQAGNFLDELERDKRELRKEEYALANKFKTKLPDASHLKTIVDEKNYISDFVVPLINKHFVGPFNKLYKKYNIKMKFVAVKYDSKHDVWFYPSFRI